ncbi:MAG: Gfo/Idh/MocA family oxidoreductase [Kiritimatiellaeota bacterium]|nr:Gfo/Idh/MocA family oxidoreductase [Kiritimatiellota bacterium]
MKGNASRRGFLKRVLAAGAAPLVLPSSLLYGESVPSNRVNIASVGVGGQGSGLFGALLQPDWIRVVAVADCFKDRRESRAEQANKRYGAEVCTVYRDFREILARADVDGVVCATPDHWHHHVAVLAMQAGKDVYIEKPLTLSIDDNKHVRDTVYRLGRVFQYGTQQRSSSHIRIGCELVRSGVLGKISRVEVDAPAGRVGGGSLTPAPIPEGLDYDMWLGPSRDRPYTSDRCSSDGVYHSSDCSIGFLGGWGAHPLDVMCWAMSDLPNSVPVEIEGTGERGEGLYDTFGKWKLRGRFADGAEFVFNDGGDRTTFVGENGSIHIARGYLKADPVNLLRAPLPQRDDPLRANTTGFHHTADFAQCIKTREVPCSGIEAAYHSDNISHLANIACHTGRKITWDIEKQTITGDDEAQKMMRRKTSRPPYEA